MKYCTVFRIVFFRQMLLSQEFSVSGWSGVFTDMLTQKSLQKMHSNRCFSIRFKTVDLTTVFFH